MREPQTTQLVLVPDWVDHPHAKELAAIGDVLDRNPEMARWVLADLVGGRQAGRGAPGMTGDQVLRAAVLKQWHQFAYRELAFHLLDSATFRAFCRFGIGQEVPKRATLAQNIRRIRPETWRRIHERIVDIGVERGVEDASRVRIDATVVETNIRRPADSDLLWDTVRVLTRLLRRLREHGVAVHFRDHTKRAKRRAFFIRWVRYKKNRIKPYRDLLRVTRWVLDYVEDAVATLVSARQPKLAMLRDKLAHFAALGRRVVDQTHRRIVLGEKVHHTEKVLSLFEVHTDLIPKDRRETQYGHKVTLTVGEKLVLDCHIGEGTPADVALFEPMLRRLVQQLGTTPHAVAADGSYASGPNLETAKELGVAEVCFSKRRGLDPEAMTSTAKVYRRLWRFRAGVESAISQLKRSFGFHRANWKGWDHFQAYVLASVVACNLVALARAG